MEYSERTATEMKALLILASLLALTHGDDDDMFAVDKKGSRKHYCGPDLRLHLMFLCDSIYKRSSPESGSMHEDWMMNFIGVDESPSFYPFRSRAKAFAVLPDYFHRHTRGVADECCSKPCTIEEMSNYCGKKPKI